MKTLKNIIILSAFIVICFNAPFSFSKSFTWTGATDTCWNKNTNWNPNTNGFPTSNDTVSIGSTTNHPSLDTVRSVYRISMTGNTFNLCGYTLTTNNYFAFSGGTIHSGTLIANGERASFSGGTVNVIVSGSVDRVFIAGSTFNYRVSLENKGTATTQSNGGSTFNAKVTLTKTAASTGNFSISNSTGNTFNDTAIFINNSTGDFVASNLGNTYFNGNIYVGSSTIGGIIIGNSGSGTSTLASGKKLYVDAGGFVAGSLELNYFTQAGSTPQSITLTYLAVINCYKSVFNGNTNLTAPGILLKHTTFNGIDTLTQTGGTGTSSYGGNTFNAASVFNCTGNHFKFAVNAGDTLNGDVTISGTVDLITYTGSILKGNFYVGSGVHFTHLSSFDGTAVFAGGNSQVIHGIGRTINMNKIKIDKTGGSVTLDTAVSINDTLFLVNKNLVTTSAHLLTMLAGSVLSGGSNSSFVSGPIKKTGNSAFTFPTGKGNEFRPVAITAPANSTDAFTSEYFNTCQALGTSMDTTVNLLSSCNSWQIDRPAGSSNVYLKFLFDTAGCDWYNGDTVHISYWNGTKWIDKGAAVTESSYKKTSNTISSFGRFTFSYNTTFPWNQYTINQDEIYTPTGSASCPSSSTAYLTKYGRISNYVPDATTPVKTVLVNFNIFQKTNGSANFSATQQADVNRLNQIFLWIKNDFFKNLDPVFEELPSELPMVLPNVSPPPVLTHSRIQFELNQIYYYPNDAFEGEYDGPTLVAAVAAQGAERLDQLNIMFTNGFIPGSGASGHATFPSSNINYNSWVVTFGKWNSGNGSMDYFCAGHLAHEIGHVLGLDHTYYDPNSGGNPNCIEPPSNPDYLWDVFGLTGGGFPSLCPLPFSSNNNIMGGLGGENKYISPLQMGWMHRSLTLLNVRRYVKCEYLNYPPIVVNSPETWDFDMKMYGDLDIQTGGSVTLTCSLEMPTNSRIIVGLAAKLIVDGGVIRGNCKMWNGIEVWGDKTLSQFPVTASPQGFASFNDAEVWDAINGVYTYKDLGSSNDLNYAGGIIRAESSSFYNCKYAARFMPYRNYLPALPSKTLNNYSYFKDCLFETNYTLKNPYTYLNSFIFMKGVQGVGIVVNTFQNDNIFGAPYSYASERGIGIRSINSRYSVTDLCLTPGQFPCTNTQSNYFHGLWYGVKVDNVNSSNSVIINHCDFDNVDMPIYITNTIGAQVTRNYFHEPVWWWNTAPTPIYGVYLDNCPTYWMEDNTFHSNFPADPKGADFGLIVNNCGGNANQVYLNLFEGLRIAAISAQDDNDGPTNSDGLKINCNDFDSDVRDDILVISSSSVTQPFTDVALIQGYCSGSGSTPARNQFLSNTCPEKQINMNFTSGQPMQYGYNQANSTTWLSTMCVSPLVQPSNCNIAFVKSTHCPPTLNNNLAQLREAIQQAEDTIAVHQALFDAGKTEWWLDNIKNGTLEGDMKDSILNESPWISEEVLAALVDNAEEFAFEDVQEILTANSLLPASVWNTLQQLDNETADNLVDSLTEAQEGENESEQAQLMLATEKSNLSLLYGQLIALVLNDTIVEGEPLDTLIEIIDGRNGFYDLCHKFSLYLAQDDFSTAAEMIEKMEELNMFESYVEVQDILLQLSESEDGIYSLLSDEESEEILRTYAEGNDHAAALAKAILTDVFDEYYPELILFPDTSGSRLAQTKIKTGSPAANYFNIYPNPSNGEFEIVINSTVSLQRSDFRIIDITGRVMADMPLNSEVQIIKINASHFNSGVYIAQLRNNDQVIYSSKLMVSK
ncbi:MAG TPA: T9SS type A sorting domain-containing protein [Bacteroidia bacterium]|nr:T9SS type A sorting domain-containing protein [Bacteroidia bacterium]